MTTKNKNPLQKKVLNLIVETQPAKVVNKNLGKKSSDLPIILGGVFMEAGKKNTNGRMYDLNCLVNAVEKFQPEIAEGRALAELEHPEATTINPDRACARIISIKQKCNQFLGEAVVLAANPEKGILGTPCGSLLASLLQYGTHVGWSSRGLGEIDTNNVVNDFHLITVDCVLQPSIGYMANSNATRFVDGILESANFVVNNHKSTELIYERFDKTLDKLPINIDAKHEKIAKAVKQFFNSIALVK